MVIYGVYILFWPTLTPPLDYSSCVHHCLLQHHGTPLLSTMALHQFLHCGTPSISTLWHSINLNTVALQFQYCGTPSIQIFHYCGTPSFNTVALHPLQHCGTPIPILWHPIIFNTVALHPLQHCALWHSVRLFLKPTGPESKAASLCQRGADVLSRLHCPRIPFSQGKLSVFPLPLGFKHILVQTPACP
jgi:hypothetical protein